MFPMSHQEYIPRAIEAHVLKLSSMYPCVTLIGPRQSGKTTLARQLFPHYEYVSMENPHDRGLFLQDPLLFLRQHPAPAIFDEVQNTPELLSYLQGIMDEANRPGISHNPGMYILTGSHQLALRQAVAQSLAGRTGLVSLLPLSLAEMEAVGITPSRDEAILMGGLPRVVAGGTAPAQAYADYFGTYLERDVRQISNVRNLQSFEMFVRLLAVRTATQINLNKLASEVGVSAPTIREWISVLEASHLIFQLPPYYQNMGKRITKTPKLYFTEVGLVSSLLGITSVEQVAGDSLLGRLFENLAVIEALKGCYNSGMRSNLYYFRDSHGFEVDLIVDEGRRPRPIEIKSATHLSGSLLHQADNVRKFASLYHPDCTPGLIYAGEEEGLIDGISTHHVRHTKQLTLNA